MGLIKIIGAYISWRISGEKFVQCYGACKHFSGKLSCGRCSARRKELNKTELTFPGYICINPKEGLEAWEEHQKWINRPTSRQRVYFHPRYDSISGDY